MENAMTLTQHLPAIRRIVTGHDSAGRAVIALDGPPPTVQELAAVPGTVFHEIWSTPATPAPIDNGADPTLGPIRLQPPPQGSRIRVVDIPPDRVQNAISPEDAAAAFAAIGAAHAPAAPESARHRLMHRTETIDYGILLSGELWLVMDEGEVKLAPGDIVVQRGTNHAWSNRSEETARIVFILIDGRFDPSIG
jgi:hypothetical protein